MNTTYDCSRLHSHLRWILQPLDFPQVRRPCARCHRIQPFACSRKFRVNGHHKQLDVWLIYRCVHCDHTWNFAIHSRQTAEQIGHHDLVKYELNDPAMASRWALDISRLKQTGAEVQENIPYQVSSEVLDADWKHDHPLVTECNLPSVFPVRLDLLLAKQLGVTRKQIHRWEEHGIIDIRSDKKSPLRSPIPHGLQLIFHPTADYRTQQIVVDYAYTLNPNQQPKTQ